MIHLKKNNLRSILFLMGCSSFFLMFYFTSFSSLYAKEKGCKDAPSYSQASQDSFVYTLLYGLLGKKDVGYYLDIGAYDPILISNSYLFEKHFQWLGVSIEISTEFENRWKSTRKNPLIIQDATQSDYISILDAFPREIDYLSLDVDGYYDVVLERIFLSDHIFKVLTVEHDFYRFGDVFRNKERSILFSQGYYLLCPDVVIEGYGSFEDWWIHPSAFPPSLFSALTSLDLKEKIIDKL